MDRRHALRLVLASSWPMAAIQAQASPDAAEWLRKGGCVLMLRHAQTDPGTGDPPDFNLSRCSTQRNLSQAGRDQAQRIGSWLAERRLSASSVQSSAWCRCKDTAELAFGQFAVLPALNSTFNEPTPQAAQTRLLAARLRSLSSGSFEIWVTHQVNITAFTGEFAGMGEAVVVREEGSSQRVLARTTFT